MDKPQAQHARGNPNEYKSSKPEKTLLHLSTP